MLKCSCAYFSQSHPSYPVKVACGSFKLCKLWFLKQTNVQWMSTRCSLVLCLCFGEKSIGLLLESGMTSLKGHGHSAGQQVRASPHCAWPPQGQAVQSHLSSAFLLPWFLGWMRAAQASSSILTSLLASGSGWLMIAGRKEAGDGNVLPSWHSLHSPPWFWGLGDFVSRAAFSGCFHSRILADVTLRSDVPFFVWENAWCVLRDGRTRPRYYQHIQTSAIFLQTKPAGRILPSPSR